MTDKDRLCELLKNFGVGYIGESNHITLIEGSAKVEGYPLFFADFFFDEDGKFVKVRLAE